ncbi:uncharacterized protein TNCV_770421 [Trichonephila clavipes]|nr:uncharacterized protein TNCV_770421 [Trichonephila clavipes]
MDSFKCVECDKTFSTVSNLNRHAKLIHNKVSTIKQVRCIICNVELISKKALEDHIDLVHNITIEKDTRTFDTFQDFKLWKESIEKQTSSLYVKNTGSKSGKTGGKITYFYCHRNGFYNARGDMKRNMKIAGSNKINGNCPSKMKVYEDIESKVTVEFHKTHKLERIHLITRQDIKNIKEEYNISSDGILDSNDVVSVNKWVEGPKNREDSPIVLFKDQNIFDENLYPGMKAEDFLLVIMNASQKDMLKFYGNDTICLDFTHGMNAYGFDLATLLVLDDKTEGFPAAFILSNRQDSTALTLAFAAIKEHTCISPRVLITDDSESFFNAWKTVFGISEKRLLCTWHVDRSWRRSIARLITKKEMQVEAYKIVRSLLVETDEAAFDIMLKEALKMFDEKEEMKEFKIYFEQTYSKRSEVWAYCHRKWYGINTNMHIESKVSSKISQLRKRHKVGQSLTSLCIENNEDEWSVSSTREERPSLDSHVTDEEMIICEDRKVLEKEAHVDNLRATSTRAEISKEEFQKECMQLLNKVSPEQYDNILTLLKNNVDSSHLFPEANQEIVSRSLNMEPPNKKIKTQRYVSTKKRLLRKPTQEECQSVSTSLVLKAKSV